MRVPHLVVLSASLLLSSCFFQPERIPFDSPRIFRGTYEAEVDRRSSSGDVAWSADGSLLAMAGGDSLHAVQLWDVATGEVTVTLGRGLYGSSVVMTPDGDRVALSLYGSSSTLNIPGEARVWDTDTGRALFRLPARTPACRACQPGALTLSPDGTLLALVSTEYTSDGIFAAVNQVSVFELATGVRLHAFSKLPGEGMVPTFSPDGTRLAVLSSPVAGEQAQVSVWEMPSGVSVGTYLLPTPNGFSSAHGWLEGPVIAVSYPDRLELRDSVSGDLVRTLVRPLSDSQSATQVFLSPDLERTLVTYLEYEADTPVGEHVLWVGEAQQAATALEDAPSTAVGFSPDGERVVTWSNAGLALRDRETLVVEKRLVNGEVVPLRIEATPTYVNASRYDVSGTVMLGDAGGIPFTGVMEGGAEETYTLFSTVPAFLRFNFDYQNKTWHFDGYPGAGARGEAWDGLLQEPTGTGLVPRGYQVTLKPIR